MHLPGSDRHASVEDLAFAMQQHDDLPLDEAARQAQDVLDVFGPCTHVADRDVDTRRRRLLYRLQDHGLVGTALDEEILPGGRLWRTHYWILRSDRITRAAGARRGHAGSSPEDRAATA